MNRLTIGATALFLLVGCSIHKAIASTQPVTNNSALAADRVSASRPQLIAQNNNTPPMLVGQDGAFLGVVSRNQYDDSSICNQYGTFGSPYSVSSVRNKYGEYGGVYSDMGAYNPNAQKPPMVVRNGQPIFILTKNRRIQGGVDPDFFFLNACGK